MYLPFASVCVVYSASPIHVTVAPATGFPFAVIVPILFGAATSGCAPISSSGTTRVALGAKPAPSMRRSKSVWPFGVSIENAPLALVMALARGVRSVVFETSLTRRASIVSGVYTETFALATG